MDHIPKLTDSPRTPPFLSLSPDLRSYKTFLKSPSNVEGVSSGQFQHQENNINNNNSNNTKAFLSDMDFESAYALLTQSPNFSMTPTAALPALGDQSSMADFKDILFQSPSPKLTAPPLSMTNLESFVATTPKYEELLSVNESNALENFLDSIIDMPQRKNNAVDPPKRDFFTAFPKNELEDDEIMAIPTNSLGLGLQTSLMDPLEQGSQLHTSSELSLQSTLRHASLESDTYGSSVITESNTPKDSEDDLPKVKKQRKRKKLLTEEEKKHHHTTSEQRRRGQIKESFDRLVSLLPLDHSKKNQSKSVVLETAGDEIQRLLERNAELRRLLEQST